MMAWNFELVAGPFKGRTGGLAWDGSAMLFSAVMEERILRFDPATGGLSDYRKYTGRTNGIAVAADGSVFGAQEGGRRVIRFLPDGSTVQTCDLLDGRHHNQPTDLTIDSRGRVWFTDPRNAVPPFGPDGIYPFPDHASVLRLERDEQHAWRLARVTHDTNAPRALALSADEATLYVADGDVELGVGPGTLRAYRLNPDGSAGTCQVLHTFGAGERGIEGLCVDSVGNLIACGGTANSGAGPCVTMFSPDGRILATQPAPADLPMRCAFGDAGLDSLYLTTGAGQVFRARSTGLRGRPAPR
jgi:gluconolactonase